MDGLCTKSELYIEKVTRWMEYVSEEPLDDSDSVLEGCSLGASEMLNQIVEGRAPRNDLLFGHYTPNESHDETPSCDIKKRLQSADSGMESEGNSPCIGPKNDLFQKYCQINRIKVESILTNHDHFNKLESEMLDCVGLQGTGSNGLPRLIVNNHDNIADGYVGLEVVDESLCALCEEKCNQFQVEVEKDYHLSKSMQRVNGLVIDQDNQDQCLLKLTKEFDYVGSKVVDQNQCLPKSTEIFDYVGLEVVDQDQCLPKSTDHVEVEVIDQNQCLSKSTENFDYVGLEVVDQGNQEQCLPKSTENFECVEVVDQNQCLCKSTENFDYIGLEVVDQDHYLPRPVEANHMSDDYVGLEQAKINDIRNCCMLKSTDKFGDYIEAEVDQGHSMSRSPEKFGNYIGLEVAHHDQCAHVCKSTETVVDCVAVEIVPRLTEKVEDTGDHCHYIFRSTQKFDDDDHSDGSESVSQNCSYQGGHEGSLSSIDSHDDEAVHHECKHYMQYNDDGYVTSPLLTGLYCS